MDLDSLRCFVVVAETLHFREASRRLALSPAAVSDRVVRLEEELETSLFHRSTRKVLLTEAGHRLLPHARHLLAQAAACAAVAHGDARRLPFSLTLGTRYELGLSWLCPALAPLAEARPERTLHLYMADTAALLDRLERGDIDAAVLSTRLVRPHLRDAVLHEEHYAFVSAGPGPTTAEQARAFTLIDATPDLPLFRYLLDALPDGPSWRFGGALYLGGIGAARHQILAGRGVGVLPRYFIAEDLAAGRLVEPLPGYALGRDHFRLLWVADHPHEEELGALAGELRGIALR